MQISGHHDIYPSNSIHLTYFAMDEHLTPLSRMEKFGSQCILTCRRRTQELRVFCFNFFLSKPFLVVFYLKIGPFLNDWILSRENGWGSPTISQGIWGYFLEVKGDVGDILVVDWHPTRSSTTRPKSEASNWRVPFDQASFLLPSTSKDVIRSSFHCAPSYMQESTTMRYDASQQDERPTLFLLRIYLLVSSSQTCTGNLSSGTSTLTGPPRLSAGPRVRSLTGVKPANVRPRNLQPSSNNGYQSVPRMLQHNRRSPTSRLSHFSWHFQLKSGAAWQSPVALWYNIVPTICNPKKWPESNTICNLI